jgi:hypothetical protein
MNHEIDTPADDRPLAEFMVELRKLVEEFEADWRDHQSKDPDNWPEQMGLADWWEQFIAFEGSEHS